MRDDVHCACYLRQLILMLLPRQKKIDCRKNQKGPGLKFLPEVDYGFILDMLKTK